MQTRIRDEVRKYIVEELLSGDARDLSDETDLQESAILDSFSTLELVHFLEATFDIQLGAEQIQPGSFRTVNSIVRMVEEASSNTAR